MSMRTAVIIQARLTSRRFPRKILADVCGRPLLNQLHRRMAAVKPLHKGHEHTTLVACPDKDELGIFAATGITPIPGPEKDILTRILTAAKVARAEKVVRVTGDCPLACPRLVEGMLGESYHSEKPFTVNWKARRFPDGMDLEVYSVDFLEDLGKRLKGDDREWFASWCVQNLPAKETASIVNPMDLSRYRLTVDYPADIEVIRKIYRAQGPDIWESADIVAYLEANPHIRRLNEQHISDFGARKKDA